MRGVLKKFFARAELAVPDDTPDEITLYRGASNVTPEIAASGLSWTPDKDVASFFSFIRGNSPMVVKAKANRLRLPDFLSAGRMVRTKWF